MIGGPVHTAIIFVDGPDDAVWRGGSPDLQKTYAANGAGKQERMISPFRVGE